MEISLGGDHGKGKFAFLAVDVIRYKADSVRGQKSKIMDFKIGQIDHGSDSVELLRPLLQLLEPGVLVHL
jgi:hypothetical protein